jgi:hypothetical protein
MILQKYFWRLPTMSGSYRRQLSICLKFRSKDTTNVNTSQVFAPNVTNWILLLSGLDGMEQQTSYFELIQF